MASKKLIVKNLAHTSVGDFGLNRVIGNAIPVQLIGEPVVFEGVVILFLVFKGLTD